METNKHIKQLIERFQSQELAKHHLEKLYERLEQASTEMEQLGLVLEKEYKVIEPLEKRSLRGLFHSILGNKETQLEIKKQEYLHVALKYNECKRMVELLDFERAILEEKLVDAEEVAKELNQCLETRTHQIAQAYPELQKELEDLHRAIDNKIGLRLELSEAIIAGLKAIGILDRMSKQLKEVRDWGNWEHSAYNPDDKHTVYDFKNSMLDKAHELCYQAKLVLLEFEDELKDIYEYQRIYNFHRYDDLEHFTDIYYSRLISDWIVQKKIQGALANVLGTMSGVQQVVDTLQNELKQTEKSLVYFEERKRKTIMDYVSKS